MTIVRFVGSPIGVLLAGLSSESIPDSCFLFISYIRFDVTSGSFGLSFLALYTALAVIESTSSSSSFSIILATGFSRSFCCVSFRLSVNIRYMNIIVNGLFGSRVQVPRWYYQYRGLEESGFLSSTSFRWTSEYIQKSVRMRLKSEAHLGPPLSPNCV